MLNAMAAYSGEPAIGHLLPIWSVGWCDVFFASGLRFASGSPVTLGDVGAISCGSQMFPLRDDAEFLSDGTLLNPGVVCRVEVAGEGEDEDTICGVWLRRKEGFAGDIAADLVKGAWALTDEWFESSVDWCEGSVEVTVPVRSRIRFSKPARLPASVCQ